MAPWGRRAAPPANRCAQRPPPPRPRLRARLRPRPAWHGAPPLREARVLKCPGPDCDASWPVCKGRKVPGEPDKAVTASWHDPPRPLMCLGGSRRTRPASPLQAAPLPTQPWLQFSAPHFGEGEGNAMGHMYPPKCHRRLEPEHPLLPLPSGAKAGDPLCDGGIRGEPSKWGAGTSTLAFPPSCLSAEPNQQVPEHLGAPDSVHLAHKLGVPPLWEGDAQGEGRVGKGGGVPGVRRGAVMLWK